VKFIADHMLGRLATWMRVIGCDVAYDSRLDAKGLIDQAEREERIILTRDAHLIKRKKVRKIYFFIQGDSYKDQLLQVIQWFEIDPYENFLTRCLRCNLPLTRIGKQDVEKKVFPYVFLTQESFYTCPLCHKIYWPATHKERAGQQLKEILSRKVE
jgi:uncharacterized protein with PIN domain